MPQPHVIVIGGPNGAGKSTIAPLILRDYLSIPDFVNADQIAVGLSAFNPVTVGCAPRTISFHGPPL